MRYPFLACLLTACVLLAAAPVAALAAASPAASTPAAADASVRQLGVSAKPWTGDFDQLLERRRIRVAVPYSRSLYFVDKGRERGMSAELVRDFERWLNKTYAPKLG